MLILAVSKRLLDAGVNLQNVTAAIGYLRTRSTMQLEHVTIMCDGEHVHDCTTSEQILDLLNSGKALFAVSIGSMWHQIACALEGEDRVDLSPVSETSGVPFAAASDDRVAISEDEDAEAVDESSVTIIEGGTA